MASNTDELNYQPLTIAEKSYLPMDTIIGTSKDANAFEAKARGIGCIRQRIKSVQREGFMHDGYVIIVYLVPAEKIPEFQALQDTLSRSE